MDEKRGDTCPSEYGDPFDGIMLREPFIEFLQREDGLYLASLDNLLDVVASQDNGFNSLMLFGHNPGLTDFVNYLVPGLTNNLPTAGVASVNLDREDWLLYDKPPGELVLHDYPKKHP